MPVPGEPRARPQSGAPSSLSLLHLPWDIPQPQVEHAVFTRTLTQRRKDLEGISALRRHPRTQLNHQGSHQKSYSQSVELWLPTPPRGSAILGPGPEFGSSLGVRPDPLPEPGWELMALSTPSQACVPGAVRGRGSPWARWGCSKPHPFPHRPGCSSMATCPLETCGPTHSAHPSPSQLPSLPCRGAMVCE